jgi:hypothetical protein
MLPAFCYGGLLLWGSQARGGKSVVWRRVYVVFKRPKKMDLLCVASDFGSLAGEDEAAEGAASATERSPQLGQGWPLARGLPHLEQLTTVTVFSSLQR